MCQVWNKIQQLWPTPGVLYHIPAPKFCSQAPTCVETVVYFFFPFNGCLGSRGAFGFVFVWVLALSFTHAMYGSFFLIIFVFSPRVFL